MRWSSAQTSCWNGVPAGATGSANELRSPAKYSSSYRRTAQKAASSRRAAPGRAAACRAYLSEGM
jgi:hypothetical protein